MVVGFRTQLQSECTHGLNMAVGQRRQHRVVHEHVITGINARGLPPQAVQIQMEVSRRRHAGLRDNTCVLVRALPWHIAANNHVIGWRAVPVGKDALASIARPHRWSFEAQVKAAVPLVVAPRSC